MPIHQDITDVTNIIISGIGGQGVLTLAGLIAEAAAMEGYDVTTAEVHGLSMRFGHLDVHVRIGKKIYSPLIADGSAHLIIGLEMIETLRVNRYIGESSVIVFDTLKSVPIKMHLHNETYPKTAEIVKELKNLSNYVFPIEASEIVKKEVGSPLYANIYLLGYCVGSNLIKLRMSSILKQLENLPNSKINKYIFRLGVNHARSSSKFRKSTKVRV